MSTASEPVDQSLYKITGRFRFVKDRSGTSEVKQVLAVEAYAGQDVAVWTYAPHADGPPDAEVALMDRLAGWAGGWQDVSGNAPCKAMEPNQCVAHGDQEAR